MSDCIHIRPYREGDAYALCKAVLESKAELRPWLPWCYDNYSIEDSHDWIDARLKVCPTPEEYTFAIFDQTERFLGGCGLNQICQRNRMANLGYWVRRSATRCGVASSAIRLLVDWAFANTQLVRLEILVATQNIPSQRAAEKAGAIREGVLRSRLVLNGISHDCVAYSFVQAEQLESEPA